MDRYCANCRAEVPKGQTNCPACGTYAGDVYDERTAAKLARRLARAGFYLVLIAAIAYGATLLWEWQRRRTMPVRDTSPVRVVRQRPGGAVVPRDATISQPEAVLLLRRHLSGDVKGECLAMSSQGYREQAYWFTAVDSCKGIRMGRWRVDANSRTVTRATEQ